ncbi:EAL domain-containing protein [Bosea massiliensis]|jgi:hypothetical protein|uniref:EAL domain-containing protein n=1 Tax=Bosea massiliensis TaxID=151419 RepID=A0ABW0P4X9_9HYPH
MIKSTGIACHEFQWRSNQSRAFHQSARRTPDNDPTEPNNERRPTLSGAHSNCGTQPAIAETLCLDFQDQGRENRSFAASIRRSFILGRCRRVPPGSRSLSLTAANFAFPHTHTKSQAIVTATINLAQALKIETTAEGVETVEQLEALRRAGASQAQGYLFAKPMPENEIPAFLMQPRLLKPAPYAA